MSRASVACPVGCTSSASGLLVCCGLGAEEVMGHLKHSEGTEFLTNVEIAPGAGTAAHDSSPFLLGCGRE